MECTTKPTKGNSEDAQFVVCPSCRQKLFSVKDCKGKVDLTVKCRRCGEYIYVGLAGTTPETT